MATMRHEPWCVNLDQVKKQIDAATICPESRSRLSLRQNVAAPCDTVSSSKTHVLMIVYRKQQRSKNGKSNNAKVAARLV